MRRRSKTVSTSVVKGMLAGALAQGMSPREFERRTGITTDELERTGRIGRPSYERVLSLVAMPPFSPEVLDDTSRQTWLAMEFPTLAAGCLNAPTLRAALACFMTCRPLVGESDYLTLRENGAWVLLTYTAEGPTQCASSQASQNFALIASILRSYAQGAATRFTASFVGPCLEPAFEAFFRGRVTWDQPANVLQFSREHLDVPSPGHNARLHRLLGAKLAAELDDLQREDSFSLSVERMLRSLMEGGRRALVAERALEHVCEQHGMTRWTLWRRLEEEGVGFRALFARVKLEEARKLLLDTTLSVNEVSDQLGFSSQSSFCRFFREEAGVSPMRYRSAALAF